MRPWVSMAPYHGAMASPGDMVLVPVMQLRFTHDQIRPAFRKGKHRGQPLYELVNDLFRGIVNPAVNLPPLEIYFHKGVWRSLNNRRLWALKAYMGLSGNFQLMVRAFISTCSPAAFRETNRTRSEGLAVEVTSEGLADGAQQEAFYNQTPDPCRFWQHGECFRGESCPYSHEDPAAASMPEDKIHLSAARRLLGKIYQKCCSRIAEIQRRESNENELEAMEQCIGSLSQVLDASCDFPSEPALALTPTEPPTRLERQGEVPVPPRAVGSVGAPAQFLDGDDRLACPTAPTPAPRKPPAPVTPVTPTCPPTWSPTVEMGIPPPPAIPPPQPQDLDLTERLSGFRTGDAFEAPNRATPAASSVAAQLFSMPAVVPDHTKMFDELGWTPAPQAHAPAPAAPAAKAASAASAGEARRWPATVTVDSSAPPTLSRSATAPVAKASRATMKEVVSRGATHAGGTAAGVAAVNAKLAPRPKPKPPPAAPPPVPAPAQRAGLQADVTGVLVKHLPSVLSQSQLLRALGEDGFDGQIDYCSLPEFQDSQGPRQAWLNFRRPSFAQELWHAWHGRRRFKHQEVALQVVQSPYQGLEENLKRCKMHQDEMPFVALDALTAAAAPPAERPGELAERGASSSASVKRDKRDGRSDPLDLHGEGPEGEGVGERFQGPRVKQKERIKQPTPKDGQKDPPLPLEDPVVDAADAADAAAPAPKGEAQARPKMPLRKAKGSCAKKDPEKAAAARPRRVEENFDRLLAEERSKHSCDLEGGQPVSDHCCLCGKPVANLKPALELSVCKAHYRMFQSEERFLATFVAARQKSDPKAPSNHLFHLSAYLNRGEESPFISDLYLGGGIAELSLLIRFLSARGHGLEERWHGLTAPFMSFILLDYAPFLAVAFADVLDVDCSRYPCILDIRARARSAMCRWSPSKRLSGLTGDALDQTVAEAVSASHDLRLPAEHMPLDAEIGLVSKRKKKKKLARTTAATATEAATVPPATDSQAQPAIPVIESTQETQETHEPHESDLNDEVPALCMAHHTWQWLTCSDVFKWAMASKKQARDYYRLSTCSCCEHVAPWSFLQDEDLAMDDVEGNPLESLGVLELPERGPAGDVPDAAAFTESEGHTLETAESEESDQSDCNSQISTADLPSAPKEKSAEPEGKADGGNPVDRGGAALAQIPEPQVVAAPPVTFKGVLRQLLQQLHGLQNLARQHPFWLHTTLSESFHLSACSKAHAALFEEAAALAVLRRQQQLRGEICDSTDPWEEDLSDSPMV